MIALRLRTLPLGGALLIAALAPASAAAPRGRQPRSPPGVETRNCPAGYLERLDLARMSGGPLRLELISCNPFAGSGARLDAIIPSPDGERLAGLDADGSDRLSIVPARGGSTVAVPIPLTFRSFGHDLYRQPPDIIGWARDSRHLWAAQQERALPSHFLLAEMRPIRVSAEGDVEMLPPLRLPSGPLDAIQWVGPDGLALAQFGTRGNYYRPAHADANPTLAIVDAARGQVRDAVELRALAPLRNSTGPFPVERATAVVLPNGRVRAVVELPAGDFAASARAAQAPENLWTRQRAWLVWTEGERPRFYVRPIDSGYAAQMALTPDGRRLLRMRTLQPTGPIVECHGRCTPPPMTPAQGPYAELVDPDTGRAVWRLSGRTEVSWQQSAKPAISPDGRYALINTLPERQHEMIALVRMRDGRIVRRFSVAQRGSIPAAFGFAPDGRRVWVSLGPSLLRYLFDPRAIR